MDKKDLKKFLIPVSVLVASLPVGANASVDKKGDLKEENEVVTSVKKQAKELTMVPTKTCRLLVYLPRTALILLTVPTARTPLTAHIDQDFNFL